MKIEKINDRIELGNQIDVELQGCLNDCKTYYAKTKGDYLWLKDKGCKVDGDASVAEIREIYEVYGYYCYCLRSAKTTVMW